MWYPLACQSLSQRSFMLPIAFLTNDLGKFLRRKGLGPRSPLLLATVRAVFFQMANLTTSGHSR